MKTLNELFREVILANELDNNLSFALRFSDPDGVRSGKSGWSFGVVQWDTRNNPTALKCLADCGFTQDEIHGVVDQTIDVRPLAAKLTANMDIIEKYDMGQLQHCLDKAGQFAEQYGIPVSDTECMLALADTINQYGSLGNASASYLLAIGRPITADDVLAMKLTWKYSQTPQGRNDTKRRANNITKVVAANGY